MKYHKLDDLPFGAVFMPQPTQGRYLFYCPGCETHHWVAVEPHPILNEADPATHGFRQPIWEFNGDVVKPTVRPSLLVQSGNEHGPTCCHSYITNGEIQYLDDCTHALKGQTIPIPQSYLMNDR